MARHLHASRRPSGLNLAHGIARDFPRRSRLSIGIRGSRDRAIAVQPRSSRAACLHLSGGARRRIGRSAHARRASGLYRPQRHPERQVSRNDHPRVGARGSKLHGSIDEHVVRRLHREESGAARRQDHAHALLGARSVFAGCACVLRGARPRSDPAAGQSRPTLRRRARLHLARRPAHGHGRRCPHLRPSPAERHAASTGATPRRRRRFPAPVARHRSREPERAGASQLRPLRIHGREPRDARPIPRMAPPVQQRQRILQRPAAARFAGRSGDDEAIRRLHRAARGRPALLRREHRQRAHRHARRIHAAGPRPGRRIEGRRRRAMQDARRLAAVAAVRELSRWRAASGPRAAFRSGQGGARNGRHPRVRGVPALFRRGISRRRARDDRRLRVARTAAPITTTWSVISRRSTMRRRRAFIERALPRSRGFAAKWKRSSAR